MNKWYFGGFLMYFIFLTSCHKDNNILEGENDYLIFGRFYGFCGGETCMETFKLTDTALFEDTIDAYRATDGFSFVKLSNVKFNMVKDIINDIPSQLRQEEEKTFGCPDCYDQGGLMIQLSTENTIKTWFLDQTKMDIPTYLHGIHDSINAKIELINQ